MGHFNLIFSSGARNCLHALDYAIVLRF